MGHYAIFRSDTGEVLQYTSCSDIENQISDGLSYVEIPSPSNEEAYWDGSALCRLPARPSPAHQFDYTIKSWRDPRTLSELKGSKWSEIKSLRREREFGSFVWDGSVFDADQTSQQRLTGAALVASMNPDFSIDWTLADNSVRTLGAQDLVAVGKALIAHVNAAHEASMALRIEIESAQTAEQVAAINWQVE